MLYVTLLGILLGVLLCFAVTVLGQILVDTVYMREENVAQRKAEIYSRLSSYVSRNEISGKDAEALARWSAENRDVTILVYDSGSRHRGFSGGKAMGPEDPPDYDEEKYGQLYPLRFQDGVYLIAIVDNSREREEFLVKVAAVVVAVSGFILLVCECNE